MPAEQAEAVSVAVRKAQANAELATKGDLREMELRMGGELKLHRWMLGFTLAGIVSLVLKAFF